MILLSGGHETEGLRCTLRRLPAAKQHLNAAHGVGRGREDNGIGISHEEAKRKQKALTPLLSFRRISTSLVSMR